MAQLSGASLGYVCAAVAVIFFGSNFVAAKKVYTGDGTLFTLSMTTMTWIVGLFVAWLRNWPQFEHYAMLGGFLWATGNITVVPIIERIGLGMGLLIWGLTNMLAGWSSGHFGLFGVEKEEVKVPALNYSGVALAIVSLLLYSRVKSEGGSNVDQSEKDLSRDEEALKKMKRKKKSDRAIGIMLSVVAGLFYGTNFDPPTHLMDEAKKAANNGDSSSHSKEALDYVFSHFCGIQLTTFTYVVLFYIYKVIRARVQRKNEPSNDSYTLMTDSNEEEKYKERQIDHVPVVVAGAVSGLIWAIAQICWFISNERLELVIAFPIITTGPGIVGALWGVFVFDEIRGKQNYMWLYGTLGPRVYKRRSPRWRLIWIVSPVVSLGSGLL